MARLMSGPERRAKWDSLSPEEQKRLLDQAEWEPMGEKHRLENAQRFAGHLIRGEPLQITTNPLPFFFESEL